MLSINGNSLRFVNMGLFDTQSEWIHPTITIDTYELIYVTEGIVHLREGQEQYSLKKGEMILLTPGIEHGGIKESASHTAFYWLHFSTDDISMFPIPKLSSPNATKAERAFKDIMQSSLRSDTHIAELILARFLLECGATVERKSKAAHEISEYVRINSSKALTVADVASRFGYAPDHVSRLLKNEFGRSAKVYITEKRLAYIESRLLNTNDTVKEVALHCGFEDENDFVKFFKYHEGVTPTQFRNEFFRIHMNAR